MKKFSFCLVFTILFVFLQSANSQTINNKNKALSERIANYDISVKLDSEAKTVSGELTLNWKNTSPDTLNELHFHLYLNAFKNTQSTFMQESGGGALRGVGMDKNDVLSWGYCQVSSITNTKKEELINSFSYIQPDNKNTHDQTVAKLMLNQPLNPSETIELKIKFETKLPKIFARSGFADNYFLVGQWFPKIGVYEHSGIRGAKNGQWNCHQYHASSEFYADFGVYKVDINVPSEFIVGATGILLNEKTGSEGTKTLSYLAEDVLDFAWTCSPKFKVIESEWNDVKISVMMQPDHLKQADRYIESLKIALEYFTEHVGPYPYKHVTVVDPPLKGMGSAGMEYPMFITAGTLWKLPDGLRFPENVTIHEFGHNYFMAILATNEFEEAWMDEGMNTYFETRIMDESYGVHSAWIDFDFYKQGDLESKITGYNYSEKNKIAPSNQFSWLYTSGGYGMMSYNKPAVFLSTLDKMLGRETMDNIWKTYYKRWKFKHPSTKDFCDIVKEVGAIKYEKLYQSNIKDFLYQSIYTTRVCDYKLNSISNTKIEPDYGLYKKDGKNLNIRKEDAPQPKFKYLSKVNLLRLGEFTVPVEIKVTFANGEEKTTVWDGKERAHIIKFNTDSKIISAQIDPDYKNILDINLSNNSYTLKPKKSGLWKLTVKFLFAIQNVFQFFSAFI